MTKKKIRIAIIDDGINPKYYYIPNISMNVFINESGAIENYEYCKNSIRIDSHGTICAAIIKKYLQHPDIEFASIKILDNKTMKGNVMQFECAINWCINNDVSVINCSFGTIQHTDFEIMQDLITKATKNKIIIVAAMHNKSIYSLPACLHGVIGVKHSYIYNNGTFKLRWYPLDDIEIITSGVHKLDMKNGEIFITPASNSYAAPVMTAIISGIIAEYGEMTYYELMLKLQSMALCVIGNFIQGVNPYPWNIFNSNINEKGNIVWDYNLYSRVILSYLKFFNNEILIPVLNIYGSNNDLCLRFIHMIMNKFKIKCINCKVITEFYDNLSPHFIPLPQSYNTTSFINNIYNKFKNDVFILYSRSNINCDINIELNQSILISHDNKTQIFNCYELTNVVELILNLLT